VIADAPQATPGIVPGKRFSGHPRKPENSRQ
jgi:hypothetical protein